MVTLGVMSPTSYRTALPRVIMLVPETGLEPVRTYGSRDFKSRASASSATPAKGVTHVLYHTPSAVSSIFLAGGVDNCALKEKR